MECSIYYFTSCTFIRNFILYCHVENLVRHSHNFLLFCIAVEEYFVVSIAFIFNLYFLCFVQFNEFSPFAFIIIFELIYHILPEFGYIHLIFSNKRLGHFSYRPRFHKRTIGLNSTTQPINDSFCIPDKSVRNRATVPDYLFKV